MQLPTLMQQVTPLSILQQAVPPLPGKIVDRPVLSAALQLHLDRREPVFLSGSAFKGKTTLAVTAARRAIGHPRWIDLAGREPAAIADIFNLVRIVIGEADDCTLVVFDDLDTSAKSRKVYASALRQMLHRAKLAGKAVLFTAQGQSEALAVEVASDWGLVMLEVPPLAEEEVRNLCIELGCPTGERARAYGTLILAQTAGQPRLAQVRAQELARDDWPAVSMSALLGNSQAVRTAKQAARELFEGLVSASEAAFVYEAAEFLYAPNRATLLRLAGLPPGLAGASTVLDRLNGRWIEPASGDRFRVTPILKGDIDVTWTREQLATVHAKLFDSISDGSSLTTNDCAAMMFHAFTALDGKRIEQAGAIILTAEASKARDIHSQLGWIVHVAVEPGMSLPSRSNLAFRTVQFRTAVQESAEALPGVVSAWRRDVDVARDPEEQIRARLLMNSSILTTEAKLPFALILEAVEDLNSTIPQLDDDTRRTVDKGALVLADAEIPAGASFVQSMLAIRAAAVQSLADLKVLIQWIDRIAGKTLLQDLDEVVGWPIARAVGAFVHWGWVNEARSSDPAWSDWIHTLDEGMAIAARKGMPVLGVEFGRAKSVILCEYMDDASAAHTAVADAQSMFGDSPVLMEQLANLHYQAKDYGKAIQMWDALVQKFGRDSIEDPFAFRRAAISAAKIGNLKRAAALFEEASLLPTTTVPIPTKVGLMGDAAYCAWRGGERRRACRLLAAMAFELRQAGPEEFDVKLQHTVVDLNRIAVLLLDDGHVGSDSRKIPYEVGQASNPEKRSDEGMKNQSLAVKFLECHIGVLEARWPDSSATHMARIRELCSDSDPLARLTAAQARIAQGSVEGRELEFVEGVAALVASYDALAGSRGVPRPDYDETRIALLVLGLCSAEKPGAAIAAWSESAAGDDSPAVKQFIISAGVGFAAPPARIRELVIQSTNAPFGEIMGAAVHAMSQNLLDGKLLARIQAQLVPSLASALKSLTVSSLDHHLKLRWAGQWKYQLMASTHFRHSPERAAEMQNLLTRSDAGTVSLAELLSVTARLVGVDNSAAVAMLR